MRIPPNSVEIAARTDDVSDEPRTAVQYGVRDGNRVRVYGDQLWVAAGHAVRDCHLDGQTVRRTITFAYGDWEDADRLLARARAWLALCGPHDAGVPTECHCPPGDPRAVIADLVAEVERLRGGAS